MIEQSLFCHGARIAGIWTHTLLLTAQVSYVEVTLWAMWRWQFWFLLRLRLPFKVYNSEAGRPVVVKPDIFLFLMRKHCVLLGTQGFRSFCICSLAGLKLLPFLHSQRACCHKSTLSQWWKTQHLCSFKVKNKKNRLFWEQSGVDRKMKRKVQRTL